MEHRRGLVSKVILGAMSLATFAFTLSKLMMVFLPDGSAPLFFVGAGKLLRGVVDSVSLHPFSVLVAVFSSIFRLDIILSMKVWASLLIALAGVALYLNAKFLSNSELVGLSGAFVGVVGFMSLIWDGEYHLALGLVLFLVFVWLMGLYLKEGRAGVFYALPLVGIALPLIDVVLTLMAVVMSVVCAVYSFTERRRSAVGFSIVATVLTFTVLTLYAMSGEWHITYLLTVAEPLSHLSASSWYVVPLALSFLGGVVGLVRLRMERRMDALIFGGFVFSAGLFTAFVFPKYTIPLLATLALVPLKFLRESYSVSKETSEDEVIVINLDVEKFFAALLALLLVIALLNAGYGVAIEVPNAHIHSQDLPALMKVSSWMAENLTKGGFVAVPFSVAPLIEGYLGPRVLDWKQSHDALAAETITETCFRIVTPHLIVDELEPLSTCRSPIMSAYDGKRYTSLLYVDDSYAKAELFKGGEAFFESPYGAQFLGYNWSENEDSIELRMCFLTSNTLLWKSVRVSKLKPVVTLIYNTTLRTDVKVSAFNLPLWIAWGKGLAKCEVSGSKVFLVIGSFEGQYSVEVDFRGALKSLRTAKSETGQEFVEGVFLAEGNHVRAEVEIRVNSSKPSQVKPVKLSLLDLPETHQVRYMLVTNSSPALSGVVEQNYEVLYVDDSFVRFTFEYMGAQYTEAPAFGAVVKENVSHGNTARSVTYKTAGLIIHKNLTFSGNNLTLTYRVEGLNDGTRLLNCSGFELWIPWERLLISALNETSRLTLTLDAAKLHLSFQGNVSFFKVEPHPQYKQLRVYVAFNLNESGTVGVSIATYRELTMKYVETTRPRMVGSDVVKLYVKSSFFRELYSFDRFVVLEILAP